IQLVNDIGIGDGIGEFSRSGWIIPGNDNIEYLGLWVSPYRECSSYTIDVILDELLLHRFRILVGNSPSTLRVLWLRHYEPFLDDNPAQQRVGSENRKLVSNEGKVVVVARIKRIGIQARRFLALWLEQNLSCRRVQWSCARKVDQSDKQREASNRTNELPMSPCEVQIFAQVKPARHRLVNLNGHSKSNIHELLSFTWE